MYETYFGLKEPPFALTPDTGYFFNYKIHQEALNVLLVALRSGEGFLKVTGEVGTGKTLLCRKLLSLLGDEFVSAYLPNPCLEPQALRKAVALELGIKIPRNAGPDDMTRLINERLIRLCSQGKRVVLCLDEAQTMSDESLEALRMLTNLETEKTKLLQVVLFGQPELDTRLKAPQLRQLLQRITFSHRLQAMDPEGVSSYIRHRLGVAGYNGETLFKDVAIKRLYQSSKGTPRLINILSHKAMMVAFGQGARAVDSRHVRMAVNDTESACRPGLNLNPYLVLGVSVAALSAIMLMFKDLLP